MGRAGPDPRQVTIECTQIYTPSSDSINRCIHCLDNLCIHFFLSIYLRVPVGVGGLSFGFQAGASKVEYIMILTEDRQVRQFSGKGQLRLGADIQLAVGPVNYVHVHSLKNVMNMYNPFVLQHTLSPAIDRQEWAWKCGREQQGSVCSVYVQSRPGSVWWTGIGRQDPVGSSWLQQGILRETGGLRGYFEREN